MGGINMKKKLFGIFALSGVLALASCGSKASDRDTFVTVCEKVVDTMQIKETKLTSLETSLDEFKVLDDYQELTIAKTMIHFVELLYKNESYPVTDKPVYITGNYVKEGKTLQYNEEYIKSSFNKEKNNVEIEFLGFSSYTDANFKNTKPAYFRLSVDYDFEKNDVNTYSFYLGQVEAEEALELIIYEVYNGTDIYSLKDYSTIKGEITSNYMDGFKTLGQETIGIELSGDYSAEYIKATDDMLGDNYFGE
jgi:hypothetical protein